MRSGRKRGASRSGASESFLVARLVGALSGGREASRMRRRGQSRGTMLAFSRERQVPVSAETGYVPRTFPVLFEFVQQPHVEPMLTVLKIKNLALVRDAEIKLGAGLNVLTGESGSGKSVVLDALALVSGASRPRLRARTGCPSGLAEAEFWPVRDKSGQLKNQRLLDALNHHGLLEACSDPADPIVLARRVEASGRSRCFIQGQTVSRAALTAVGEELLELCGQSEAHGLRTPAAQLDALDQFGNLTNQRRALTRLFKKMRLQEAECEKARLDASEAERRRDFLEFQISELSHCDLADLEEKRARLSELDATHKAQSTHQEVVQTLRAGNHAVLGQLNWLACRLDQVAGESAAAILEPLNAAIEQIEVATQASVRALSECPRSQEEREQLGEELKALEKLADKHRISVEELPTRLAELALQLAESQETEAVFQDLVRQTAELRAEAEIEAENLHLARRKAAVTLESRVKKELCRVGLDGAQLETHLSRGELGATGITHLDIGFSANPGHDAQPLSRVASGGELARVLLCFRLATESNGALLTFDEIDAGAGGKTADKIAQALLRAGKRGQVLCVTHWAQVAGIAQTHFSVSKKTEAGHAATTISEVDGESRLGEISRMLGGAEQTARQHASRLVVAA